MAWKPSSWFPENEELELVLLFYFSFLLLQVEVLHKQLVQLRLEEVLGQPTLHSMADPQAAAQQRFESHLQQLKAGVEGVGKQETGPASYSLHVRKARGGGEQQELGDLEARLARLEAALGQDQESYSVLAMETNKKTVTQAVQVTGSYFLFWCSSSILTPGTLSQDLSARPLLPGPRRRQTGCSPAEARAPGGSQQTPGD